jgi:hypothetical protein
MASEVNGVSVIEVNGVSLFQLVSGANEPLVLVRGSWDGPPSTWTSRRSPQPIPAVRQFVSTHATVGVPRGPVLLTQGDRSARACLESRRHCAPSRHAFGGAGHVPHETHPREYVEHLEPGDRARRPRARRGARRRPARQGDLRFSFVDATPARLITRMSAATRGWRRAGIAKLLAAEVAELARARSAKKAKPAPRKKLANERARHGR